MYVDVNLCVEYFWTILQRITNSLFFCSLASSRTWAYAKQRIASIQMGCAKIKTLHVYVPERVLLVLNVSLRQLPPAVAHVMVHAA